MTTFTLCVYIVELVETHKAQNAVYSVHCAKMAKEGIGENWEKKLKVN